MSNIEVDTIDGPAHWASYLINGDASGLTEEDEIECDDWQQRLAAQGGWYVVSCEGDEWFGRFEGMGGNLVNYILQRQLSK